MNDAPDRLADRRADDDAALADMLRAARTDVLSDDEIRHVRAGLIAAGVVATAGALGVGGGAVGAVAKPAATWVGGFYSVAATKIGVATLVVAGLGGGAWAWHRRSVSAPSNAIVTSNVTSTAASSPLVRPPSHAKESITITQAGDVAPPNAVASAAPSISAPEHSATPRRTLAGTPSSSGSAAVPREGVLLLEARRALETDPTRALRLAHEHEIEFPTSQLVPERARIIAEAQKRLAP